MQSGQHPDAIDTRLVLRIYGWIILSAGLAACLWPNLLPEWIPQMLQLPNAAPYARFALTRIAASVVVFVGTCAVGLAGIEDPISRRRGLATLALAHVVFGMMFGLQIIQVLHDRFPTFVGWTPLVAGLVLLYVALTSTRVPRFDRPFVSLGLDGPVLIDRAPPGRDLDALRSQYEQQIRQAARTEERTRLARDLHDAVKQQLFAIQTSAATAQTRLDVDASGARTALEQVRTAARDATAEMDTLIGQLQSPPMENTGLVEALRQQCEALGLRTGAKVSFEAVPLPPSSALPPGAQQALFRAAQEALANIGRHARAASVSVRLDAVRGQLELVIRDDGVGFEPMEITPGMGTENMKARIGEVSGRLLLHSKPGRGTTVAFSIPFDVNSPRHYSRRALVWTAVVALMLVSAIYGDAWERPWNILIALIAGVTVARYVVAWSRVRHRGEAAA